jgi:hypothetical protein
MNNNTLNRLCDFFILGMPKSGSTFLRTWLSLHPNIHLNQRELNYFCNEQKFNSEFRSLKDYQNSINNDYDPEAHVVVGEKTAFYFFSPSAGENIYNYNNNAKVIVCLRNPIEAVQSYHNHMCRMGYETCFDFMEAYSIQDRRKYTNYRIPKFAIREAIRYQYKDIYNYPAHLKRLYHIFPPEQVHIVLLDDIIDDPQKVIDNTCEFLGVEKIQQVVDRKAINVTKAVRRLTLSSRMFYFLYYRRKRLSANIYWSEKSIKRYFLILLRVLYSAPIQFKLITHPYDREHPHDSYQPSSSSLMDRKLFLLDEYKDIISETAELLGRPLSSWTSNSDSPTTNF